MPRPTVTLPTWATTGTKLEPPTGKRSLGWIVDEPPPAEWWNYLQNSTGEWLTFLNAVILGEATADLALRFAQSSAAADIVPLIAATSVPNGAYRLVARFPTSSPTVFASLYVGGSAARKLVLAHNASWNGTQWAQNSAATAQALALTTANTIEVLTHAATPTTWADNAWAVGSYGPITTPTLHVTTTGGNCATFDGNVSVPNVLDAGQMNATHLRAFSNADIQSLCILGTDDLKLQSPVDISYDLGAGMADYPTRYVQLDVMRPIVWNISPPEPLGTLEIYGSAGLIGNTHATNSVWVEFPVYVPRGTQRVSVALTWRSFGPTVKNKAKLIWWPRAMGTTNPQPHPDETYSQVGPDIDLPGFSPIDVYVTSLTYTGLLVVNDDNRYSVIVKLAPGSVLYGIKFGFADPGARNG